jgi:hypothetical protein
MMVMAAKSRTARHRPVRRPDLVFRPPIGGPERPPVIS